MWKVLVERPGFELRRMTRARARVGVLVGLLFLAGPVSELLGRSYGPGHLAALLLGTSLFVVVYISLLPPSPWVARRGPAAVVLGLALLPLLAIVLLLGGAPQSFAALFVYFAAAVGMLLPAYAAIGVIFVTALGIGVTGAVHGVGSSSIAATVLTVVAIGMMMSSFGRIARTNRELQATRDELARLAVSEERLRIARDLHDLLGHSLSVIALKAELAGRLLSTEPTDAGREIADVETVARKALGEVREAVSGYRQPTLDGELAGARLALSTAGIDVAVDRTNVTLDPEVEAVLSWAVREGATNVIRHSGAKHCKLRVRANMTEASAEVIDDGVGSTGASNGGSGLPGLAERASELRGRLESGPLDAGGFRLAVTVPRGASAAVAP
jgi:two-component system sensor histidine kinase DesK